MSILKVLILSLPWCLPLCLEADQPGKLELSPAEFKAVILSKIPAYIQWPDKTLPDSDTKIIVGILGKDPFDGMLAKLFKDQKINDREIVVKTFEDASQFTKCHILFVPAEFQSQWQELSKRVDAFGILSVGETDEFMKLGGVFNLSVKDRKLEIHLKNAKKAGLEINSKLLKIAKVIK